jgi:hypothetical protein
MVDGLIGYGHVLSDIGTYTLRALYALHELGDLRHREDKAELAQLMRLAYHAQPDGFKKAMAKMSVD